MEELKVNGRLIRIHDSDMEKIRIAVMDRLSIESDDMSKSLYRDLRDSEFIPDAEELRIGRWVLIQRGNGIALKRIPPRNDVNYFFGATLNYENGSWVVEELFEERMVAR